MNNEHSDNVQGINVWNPSKDVAKEVTLQILIRHRDATQLAREGLILGMEDIPDNDKKRNKVRGLYKIISTQKEMINISRPIVRFGCENKWKRKNITEEDQLKNPFSQEKNDYNDLMMIKEILSEAELDLVKAEQSTSQKDDYLIEKTTSEGKTLVLTQKYYDMLNGLEETYEQIDLIMLKHKIVSAGIEEDEIKTYKEQEQEAIRRVVDA